MSYLAVAASIISLGIVIWVLNFLRHLRADLETTVTWLRSSTSDLDLLSQRLGRTTASADQSSRTTIRKP